MTAKARPSVRTVAVVGFAVAVLVIAGLGFVYKMTEFAETIVKDDVAGFGAVAVSIYLVGMVPIMFLTLWAVLTGRFRDIERPKFRLLELDREIERGGGPLFTVETAPVREVRRRHGRLARSRRGGLTR